MANPLTRLDSALLPALGGAFFVFVWEWAITFDDEVELIWPRKKQSALKWLYLFARYFVFISQLFHRVLEITIRFQYNLNPQRLRFFYCSRVLAAALSVSALETLLMLRVYALYMKKRTVIIILGSLLAMELIVAIVGLGATLSKEAFMPLYVISHLPRSFIYFGVSGLLVQSIILALTLIKYLNGTRTMKAIPLVQLMVRDGTMIFFFVTVFLLVVVIYTFRQHPFGVVALAWLLTIVSASTCRLIVNMLRLPSTHEGMLSTTLRFTTVFTDRIAFETVQSHQDSMEGWPA